MPSNNNVHQRHMVGCGVAGLMSFPKGEADSLPCARLEEPLLFLWVSISAPARTHLDNSRRPARALGDISDLNGRNHCGLVFHFHEPEEPESSLLYSELAPRGGPDTCVKQARTHTWTAIRFRTALA